MYIIAGLGNPGTKYVNTRHNVGFDAVDAFASKHGVKVKKSDCRALSGEVFLNGEKILLVKPQTFMNNSGESLRDLLNKYKLPQSNLIVLYDDMSLETGKIRVREKGSHGGHNGMKSIIYHLQGDEFPRIKIGIGAPPFDDAVNYVLGKLGSEEVKILTKTVITVCDCIETIVKDGVTQAMNDFNGYTPQI